MRTFLALLLCSIFFSCHHPKKDYPIPSSQDINDVVRAVISQQTIVERNDSAGRVIDKRTGRIRSNSLGNLSLSVDLIKVKVVSADLESNYKVPINFLIDPKMSDHFDQVDYNYLFFQNDTLSRFKIDTAAIANTVFTNATKLEKTQGKNYGMPYYWLSIPVFSLDKKQAYVVLDVFIGMNNTQGYAFIVKKINDKWLIVRQWSTWIS
jgi:hypothetical protein